MGSSSSFRDRDTALHQHLAEQHTGAFLVGFQLSPASPSENMRRSLEHPFGHRRFRRLYAALLIHCSWPSSLWRIEARRNRRQRRQRLVFALGRPGRGGGAVDALGPRCDRSHFPRVNARRRNDDAAHGAAADRAQALRPSTAVPVSVSRLSTHHLRNVSLKWGNFFCSDPSNADAIVCYLMPGVMAKLRNFIDKAIRPGTFVVTNTSLFRERQASAVRRRGLRGTVALYIWPGRHWTVKDGDDIARV